MLPHVPDKLCMSSCLQLMNRQADMRHALELIKKHVTFDKDAKVGLPGQILCALFRQDTLFLLRRRMNFAAESRAEGRQATV
jgi:hypothetical protein